MSILRSIMTIFGAIFLASCGNSGEYCEKTPEQVTHAIKSAHLPTHVLGKQIKRSRVTQPAPDTVVTTLLGEGGREMMHFVTTVTPDGTGSRVATEIAVPEGVKERLDEAVAKDPMANYAMNLMHVVAREHVVAAIEGRPFDMTLGNPKAEVAMQMNPEMHARIEEANKAASDMAKQEQQMHFSQSYGNDWGDSGAGTGDGWGN